MKKIIGRNIANDMIIKESRGPFHSIHGIAIFMMLLWKS